MNFFKSDNRFRFYNTILKDDFPAVLCLSCSDFSRPCIRMENHPKCVEYVRRGRPCVGTSWKSLNRTRDKLKSELNVAEEKLIRALIKIAKLKKTLKHTKSKIAEKTLCLINKFADDNDEIFEDDQDFFFADLFFDFWQFSIFSVAEIFLAVADSFLNS